MSYHTTEHYNAEVPEVELQESFDSCDEDLCGTGPLQKFCRELLCVYPKCNLECVSGTFLAGPPDRRAAS